MEDRQLDNVDVDVGKLISFIKRRAAEAKAGEPASAQLVSRKEQTSDLALPDVSVETAEPAEPETVFKAQADFNQQLLRSLTLLESCVQGFPQDLARVERGLDEETARSLQSTRQIKDQIEQLPRIVADLKAQTELATASASETEQRIIRELQSVEETAQAGFGALQTRLEQESGSTADLIAQSSAQMSALLKEVGRVRDEVAVALKDISKSALEAQARLSALEQKMESLSSVEGSITHQLDELKIRVLRTERVTKGAHQTPIASAELVAPNGSVLRDEAKSFNSPANGNGFHKVGPSSNRSVSQPFDYFLFEHRFRGPVAEIKGHHMIYLDLFRGREDLLDLGCGRGEFVELLSEHGARITGVDINEDMVDFCRDRGLNVLRADLFSHLTSLSDNCLDGIFTSQLIEHLSFNQLWELIGLCGRKLKRGGILVAETINPNCFDALCNFYLDPSHVRPNPAKMIWFLVEQQQFRAESLIFSSPISPDADKTLTTDFALPDEVSLYKDYAMVATKV